MLITREEGNPHRNYDINDRIVVYPGMELYTAERRQNNKPVLLRIFKNPQPFSSQTPDGRLEMFQKINSPKILKMRGAEIYRDETVFVFEGFDGVPLNLAIKNQLPVKIDQFLRLSVSITDAAREIHKRGMCHCFINPSSILVDTKTLGSESVKLKIGAFSGAFFFEKKSFPLKSDFLEPSNLPYIAPEKTGEVRQPVDYRADFYSLGVVFYELLVGELPFKTDGNRGNFAYNRRTEIPRSPHERDAKIPVAISDIVMTLLSPAPENRYQSSCGLTLDLEECLRLLKKRKIEKFQAKGRNISENFQISQKLHGRGKELDILTSAFEEATLGATRIILLQGEQGVGKTALVNELRGRLDSSGKGAFIEGKFAFDNKNPHSAIIQAFRRLERYFIGQPDETLDRWKRKLKKALGDNLSVIFNLIPEIEEIAGEQRIAQKLNPLENKNRFLITFHNFVKLFCGKNNPLALFLDDLQWADESSLELIQTLATSGEIKGLLLIGAYRDNEVAKDHICGVMVDEVKKTLGKRRGETLHEISLKPLGEPAVNAILADSLYRRPDHSEPLAVEVHKRTAGNPFFVREFLRTLREKNTLSFNHDQGRWIWNIEEVRKLGVTANVAELLSENFKNLREDVREYLKAASCVGESFDLGMLCKITGEAPEDILEALMEAVKCEIIIPLKESDNKNAVEGETRHKFPHDNLRQNIYSFLNGAEERDINLKAGRILLKDKRGLEDKVVDVIRYLNKGRKLLKDPREKYELAGLNLMASRQVKTSAAYHSALEYLGTAMDLLPEDVWKHKNSYSLAFDIHREYAECACICGECESSEKVLKSLEKKSRTDIEKSGVLCMLMSQYTVDKKMEKAKKEGIKALSFLGIDLPENPGMKEMEEEIASIEANLAGRDIAELADIPELEASEHEKEKRVLTLKILMELYLPSYLTGNVRLSGLLTAKMVNFSILHGNHPYSAFGYAAYGIWRSSMLHDLETGYEFGKLSVKVNDKLRERGAELRCRIYFIYAALILHWNAHWEDLKDYFDIARDAGIKSGDVFFLCYALNNMYLWLREHNLNTPSEDYVSNVALVHYPHALDLTRSMGQFALSLQGKTNDRFSLSDDDFDEHVVFARMYQGKLFNGTLDYALSKGILRYFYGDYRNAIFYFKKANAMSNAMLGLPWIRILCFYNFLARAAVFKGSRKDWEVLNAEYEKMKLWSDNCRGNAKDNFSHCRYLMEAEMARLKKTPESFREAAEKYDMAIKAAHNNNFPQYEAVANELAAKLFVGAGNRHDGRLYMMEAINLYTNWGATAKVEYMRDKYAYLLNNFNYEDTEKEIQILRDKIKKTAGAQKARIIILKNGKLDIKGTIGKKLPVSVIKSVARSRNRLLLDNADSSPDFNRDPYIRRNAIKSILCFPVLAENNILGVIYLENALTPKAFIEEQQVEILNLVAPKMALFFSGQEAVRGILDVLKNIVYIKAADHHCEIFCEGSMRGVAAMLLKTSLDNIESYFSKSLIRVHKSHIVNIHKISKISRVRRGKNKRRRYEIVLNPWKQRVPIGAAYENALRNQLPDLFKLADGK